MKSKSSPIIYLNPCQYSCEGCGGIQAAQAQDRFLNYETTALASSAATTSNWSTGTSSNRPRRDGWLWAREKSTLQREIERLRDENAKFRILEAAMANERISQ